MSGKSRQISKIAKELELSTPKVLDFLQKEHPEVDVSKNIMTKVEESVYISILKKFKPDEYKSYIESTPREDEAEDRLISAQKKHTDIKSRMSEEIEGLMSVNEDSLSDKATARKNRRKVRDSEEMPATDVLDVQTPQEQKQEEKVQEKPEPAPIPVPVPEPEAPAAEVPEAETAVEVIQEKSETPAAPAFNSKDEDPRHAIRRPLKKLDRQIYSSPERKSPPPSQRPPSPSKPSPQSSAHPASQPKPAAAQADDSDDKKLKKVVKKTDDKDSIKEDKNAKGKAVFKRKRFKKVAVVVAEGGVVETADDALKGGKKKRKKDKVSQEDVKGSVKDTLSKMSSDTAKSFKKRKKKKAQADGTEIEIEVNVIKASEFISTSELANKMGISVTELITKCFSMGLMITINQRLDKETIEVVAAEFDTEVEFESEYDEDFFYDDEHEDPSLLKDRNPIITIMGHVDHGKTSLLDYIRKTKVVAGESGGITQHIGAYVVDYKEKNLTFLDTPGHEAFTAMRARGAKITDIVIIVIAADDRVNAQTNEAIDHALLAEVPIIFALNKMDRPSADPERIRTQLSQRNILVEQWGGKFQSVEISALTGHGINDLLDAILLEADMLELKANPSCQALGTVLESKLDRGFGAVSTILVQKGTLRIGDNFVCGQTYGRVRAMLNERRENVKEAAPSFPVMVLGFSGSPNAGDSFVVVELEQTARTIASRREQINRAQAQHKINIVTLDNISEQVKLGDIKNLNLIIKADADGSVEAIRDTLMKVASKEVAVRILSKGVGAITEGDVLLAEASGAIILGFHVRPNSKAKEMAAQKKVEIRIYSIIYDLFEEVKGALEGMLKPLVTQELLGSAEVRAIFKVPKMGTIAGCYVLSGKVIRNALLKVIRDSIEIYQGRLTSLKRLKDDAREVVSGYECGIGIENFNDLKEHDIIEVFELKETQRKLEL
jgi:translation initiation factor IF-2